MNIISACSAVELYLQRPVAFRLQIVLIPGMRCVPEFGAELFPVKLPGQAVRRGLSLRMPRILGLR